MFIVTMWELLDIYQICADAQKIKNDMIENLRYCDLTKDLVFSKLKLFK